MKKLLSIFMVICLIFTVMSFGTLNSTVTAATATSGITGDCTWSHDGTVLTISGNGAMGDYDYLSLSYAPWGEDITKVIIENGVTSIGDEAFRYCSSLTSITIPDSVTSIGDYAFYDCASLTNIVIPDSVTDIGSRAFYNTAYYKNTNNWVNNCLYIGDHLIKCEMIQNGICTLKDSTTAIADSAFESCYRLTGIVINEDNPYYSNDENGILFNKDKTALLRCPPGIEIFSYTIPASVTSIGDSAFENCSGLISVTIPNNVTSIGNAAFRWCDGLINITIPNGITCISDWTFYSCDDLRGITIPNSVTSIGYFAFDQCHRLTTVFYRGTKSNKMDISIKLINSCLTDATWYYNHCIGSEPHTYTNNCDTDCNYCGTKRSIKHTYSDSCDTTCNVCTAKRTIKHTYGTKTKVTKATLTANGKIQNVCSVCGYVSTSGVKTVYRPKTMTLSTTIYRYDGKVKAPSVTVKDYNGKTLVKNTDYTVTYASGRKAVGKYAVTIKFIGKYSGTKTLYFYIAKNLSAPSKVTASLYGYDDVKVSWSKVSGATAYKVYYKAGSGSYKLKTTTKSTSYKFNNLSDGKKYYFKVVPCTKVNDSYYADDSYKTGNIYTLKKISTPTIKKSGSKVKVSWKNISGESGYQISQSTSKSKTKIVATYKTTSGKSKILKAKKGKTYYYKVRAFKTVNGKKIYGPWSSVKAYKLK